MIRIFRFAGLYLETLLTFTQTQLHTPPIALPSLSSFHQLTHTQSHILIIQGLDSILYHLPFGSHLPTSQVRGASKIKLKKVNKKRTVTVRRVIIFLNISRRPLLICLQCCLHQYKTLKAEGERLKVEFWSSEMVKIGRGQQNYRRCRCRHRLQSFATMKKKLCNQISNGCLEKFQKKLGSQLQPFSFYLHFSI